jgi:hypothetical protein
VQEGITRQGELNSQGSGEKKLDLILNKAEEGQQNHQRRNTDHTVKRSSKNTINQWLMTLGLEKSSKAMRRWGMKEK